MVNELVWEGLQARVDADAGWKAVCVDLHSGWPSGASVHRPTPHVIWFDGLGGEVGDAFDSDIEVLRGQFTLISGEPERSVGEHCIGKMLRHHLRLMDDAEWESAEGHVELLRQQVPQVYNTTDGMWEARVDYEAHVRLLGMVPAHRG